MCAKEGNKVVWFLLAEFKPILLLLLIVAPALVWLGFDGLAPGLPDVVEPLPLVISSFVCMLL